MFDAIGRPRVAVRNAQQRNKAMRMLNNLPTEAQEGIGCAVVTRPGSRTADMPNAIWGVAR